MSFSFFKAYLCKIEYYKVEWKVRYVISKNSIGSGRIKTVREQKECGAKPKLHPKFT